MDELRQEQHSGVCPPPPQKEMDKAKGQRDYEEKMIVSAWYNMVRTGTTQESHRT